MALNSNLYQISADIRIIAVIKSIKTVEKENFRTPPYKFSMHCE